MTEQLCCLGRGRRVLLLCALSTASITPSWIHLDTMNSASSTDSSFNFAAMSFKEIREYDNCGCSNMIDSVTGGRRRRVKG